MVKRFRQFLLIASVLWLSWMLMMIVHEMGHVLGAVCSGGSVRRVVWYPTVFSRTDVWPNPHRLVEVWAGPLIGSFVPAAIALLAARCRLKIAYLLSAIAGFCLLANGAYIGVGAFAPVGDTRELLAEGMPRWILTVFGCLAVGAGFGMWHRVSPRFGFGDSPVEIVERDVYGTFIAAVVITGVSLVLGKNGAL